MILARSTKHLNPGYPKNAVIISLALLAARKFIRIESFLKIDLFFPGLLWPRAYSTGRKLREPVVAF